MTAETVEQLVSEIGKIKTQMNTTELQLYEANEKIAELIENVCNNLFLLFDSSTNFSCNVSASMQSKEKQKKIRLKIKIVFLLAQHQHLREENENLKVENSNLTKVAKLMTNSMKESMDTSKR